MSDKDLDAAISRVIAEKIIAGLDDEHRAAFLTRAVTAALKEYDCRRAVEKAVAGKAAAVAAELLAGGEWEPLVVEAVRNGFALYIADLPGAVAASLREAIHGKDGGSYERSPGAILRHLTKGAG